MIDSACAPIACLFPLIIKVRLVGTASFGSDTGVFAIEFIAIFLALGVEDFALSHVFSDRPKIVRLDANIPLLALACHISLIIIIPAVAVVSGVDASVGAPIKIAIALALHVVDLLVTHVWSVSPDAGNFNLGCSEPTVQRRLVADIHASPMVLVVSAVAP